jgi:hypothetical protein|tara:strand:+ start:1031 stop:1288 length:258 start_codon:yes stop_codon:yes gene_type:complete
MYMMRNKKEVIMKLGTKIIGDFGAMLPLWEGEIVTIDSTYGSALEEAKIKWDDNSHTWMLLSDINSPSTANGSSIGYYTEEAYYE